MTDSVITLSLVVPDSRFQGVRIARRSDGRHIRLTNGRRHRAVGRYASIKMGSTIPWESRLELHDLYRAEVDPAIVSYAVQPETLQWEYVGKRHRYTPDRLDLMFDGSTRVVEIKDRFDPCQDAEYTDKLDQAAHIYAALGRAFEVRERSQINVEPDFSAIEEIQAYRRSVVTVADVKLIRTLLRNGRLYLRDVLEGLERPNPRPVLFAMMVRRIVAIDLAQGLRGDATVSLVDRPCE